MKKLKCGCVGYVRLGVNPSILTGGLKGLFIGRQFKKFLKNKMKIKKTIFKRICKKCEKSFESLAKKAKVCEKCNKSFRRNHFIKTKNVLEVVFE